MKVARAPSGPILRIGQITELISEVLEETFSSVWVEGEVSNVSRPQSGHVYFSMKEGSTATLKAVMYRGVALRCRFDLRDGMEVLARGRLSVYKPRGEYQFNVEEMQPKGIGAHELALRQLKEKLLARGFFSPERKKSLPAFPRRIALVASATGAAIRDMLEILGSRWPLAEIIVRPSRVQGDGAATEIALAIQHLNRLHGSGKLPLEAIIIGRGGGSSEDLSAFNEEIVAEAIFASQVPIVSAVGHEIDVTIADLVADRRALTPSEAAVAATPDQLDILRTLREGRLRLDQIVRQRIERGRDRLRELMDRRALRAPLEKIREEEHRLDELADRLRRGIQKTIERENDRLSALVSVLHSLSPLNVLRRGYTLTRSFEDAALIRSTAQVHPGMIIETRTNDGSIRSRVESIEPIDESSAE